MTGCVLEALAAALHLGLRADLIECAVDFGLDLGSDASTFTLFDGTLS